MDIYPDQDASFQTFNQSVAIAAGTTPLKLLDIHSPARYGKQTITFQNTGANPIDSSFNLSRASIDGGTAVSVITGAEFSSPDGHLLIDSPGFAWPIPAGGIFQLTLDLTGIAELQIWGASTLGTTLSAEFSMAKIVERGFS